MVAVVTRWFRRHPTRRRRPRRACGDAVRAALGAGGTLRRTLVHEHLLDLDHADAGRVESELRSRGVAVLDSDYGPPRDAAPGRTPDQEERLAALVAEPHRGRRRKPGWRASAGSITSTPRDSLTSRFAAPRASAGTRRHEHPGGRRRRPNRLAEFDRGYLLTSRDARSRRCPCVRSRRTARLVVPAPGPGSVRNVGANLRVTLLFPPVESPA